MKRMPVAALALSAAGFAAILGYEGYSERAYQPLPGDHWTVGFGSTTGVHEGEVVTPEVAVTMALDDVQRYEKAIKQCVTEPMTQQEWDAYVSLCYNIGTKNFCSSTLVRRLNGGDHKGACEEILRWHYFKGQSVPGLVTRRKAEYNRCMEGING